MEERKTQMFLSVWYYHIEKHNTFLHSLQSFASYLNPRRMAVAITRAEKERAYPMVYMMDKFRSCSSGASWEHIKEKSKGEKYVLKKKKKSEGGLRGETELMVFSPFLSIAF